MTEWVILLVAGYVAATISGAAGFGGALLLLPVLAYTVGVKEAVPILTIAQLMGNLSRAWFGHSAIQWRPALAFSAGAVPASIIGARLFIELPSDLILRLVGVFLLGVVALRHTAVGRRPFPGGWLPVAGAIVGFLSAVVGSAGPLGAAVFLSLQLPKVAYVASEAVHCLAWRWAVPWCWAPGLGGGSSTACQIAGFQDSLRECSWSPRSCSC